MDDRNCMVDYQYKIEDGHLSTEQNYGLLHYMVNNFFNINSIGLQTAQLLGYPKTLLLAAYQIVKEVYKMKHHVSD